MPSLGKAMRRHVADALHVAEMVGVHRVTPDAHEPHAIVYVKCSAAVWAHIQARAAQYVGVEHTGTVRQQMLTTRFQHRPSTEE